MKLMAVYPVAMLVVLAGIAVMYRHKASSTIAVILLYMISLSTMKLSVKTIFMEYMFVHPRFLTACHLLMSAIVGLALMVVRNYYRRSVLAVPTQMEFMFRLVPIGTAWTLSIGLENFSLMFCSAAFTEIMGSIAPVTTVIVIIVLGMRFKYQLLAPILLVFLGCCISVKGEVQFSGFGMGLCLGACMCRSVKAVLQQEVMTGQLRSKFDPVTLLTWQCSIAFFVMFVWSLISEGAAPYIQLASLVPSRLWGTLLAVLVSAVNAVVLNLLGLFVIRELGALGVQLVSQVKAILTVLGDMALLGEPVSLVEVAGFATTLLGVFLFARIDHESDYEKKRLSQAQ